MLIATTLTSLQRRVTHLQDQARILYPEKKQESIFHLDWHTPEDRAKLEPLKRAIEAKVNASRWFNIRDYTQEEKDAAILWLDLEEAMERGDNQDQQAIKHWLQYTPEETIEAFWRMQETDIPEQAYRRVGYATYNARKHFRDAQYRIRKGNIVYAYLARQWLAAWIPEHAPGRTRKMPVWTIPGNED